MVEGGNIVTKEELKTYLNNQILLLQIQGVNNAEAGKFPRKYGDQINGAIIAYMDVWRQLIGGIPDVCQKPHFDYNRVYEANG